MANKTKKNAKQIDVQQLCLDHQLEIVNQSVIKKWKPILRPAINRAGFELLGHFYTQGLNMNIIGWGTAESNYMDLVNEEDLRAVLNKIFIHHPPLVICSQGVNQRNRSIVLEQATLNDIPVAFSNTKLSFLTTTIGIYIAEYFAPEERIHGSLVIINGVGVLIMGESGIGKSEAVLELIQKGHIFVSDDAVDVQRIGNEFIGYSPAITKNILESRGLGLIDIRTIYGDRAVKNKSNINLVVELKMSKDKTINEFDRLGNQNNYFPLLGGKISKIDIPVRLGRNLASLIEVASNLFAAKKNGSNPLATIQKRTNEGN